MGRYEEGFSGGLLGLSAVTMADDIQVIEK
jgi:hypothetical protein